MHKGDILLIEGGKAGENSLAFALQKSGFSFHTVHTATAAFASIEEGNRPDLVILDVTAMRSNGARTCRHLRHLLGDTPIIYCYSQQASQDLKVEADVYLQRPFTSRKLINRVRALLPIDEHKEEIVRCGPLTLYLQKRSIEVSDQGERKLTPKLTELLVQFLRHPEEIIYRSQLIHNIWKTDYVGDTRTLDVHIRWVRERIEPDPAKPRLIVTVRGAGYIFRPSQFTPDSLLAGTGARESDNKQEGQLANNDL